MWGYDLSKETAIVMVMANSKALVTSPESGWIKGQDIVINSGTPAMK